MNAYTETETYIIVDRKTHEILSPAFTTVEEAHNYGLYNIIYFYQDYAQITLTKELQA